MFSEDGSRLYARSFDAIRIWDTATQKAINTVRTGSAVTEMALSPDGKRPAVADYNYIQELEADGGKTVGPEIKARGHAAEGIGYGGGVATSSRWVRSNRAVLGPRGGDPVE
jgi:DNA-binding beta-propeller fold protein YncE